MPPLAIWKRAAAERFFAPGGSLLAAVRDDIQERPPARDPENSPAADYTVGYGRPPVATRFQPGRSGNPRGRPKGARNLAAIVAAALGEPVTVTQTGRSRRITKLEAAVKQLVNRAAGGDARVTQLLLALVQSHEARPKRTGAEFASQADAAVIAGLMRRLTERR
jgi:hypothetical protein